MVTAAVVVPVWVATEAEPRGTRWAAGAALSPPLLKRLQTLAASRAYASRAAAAARRRADAPAPPPSSASATAAGGGCGGGRR